MPAPLYIALIRYANGSLDIRTYITPSTIGQTANAPASWWIGKKGTN